MKPPTLLAACLQLLAEADTLGSVKVEEIKEAAKAQTAKVSTIGDFIREQREQAQVSVRQLSRLAGVSNPYLSQIERGLRKPSAEILQQIAKGLRISAEQLYVKAGILEERAVTGELGRAILADAQLTERQKGVLIEIYESFRRENAATAGHSAPAELADDPIENPTDDSIASPAGADAVATETREEVQDHVSDH